MPPLTRLPPRSIALGALEHPLAGAASTATAAARVPSTEPCGVMAARRLHTTVSPTSAAPRVITRDPLRLDGSGQAYKQNGPTSRGRMPSRTGHQSQGNSDSDAASAQVSPDLPAAVALIAGHTIWANPWPSSSWSLDRSCLHQSFKHTLLMALSCRDQSSNGLTAALGPQVDLGTEAALAASQRFV